MILSIEVLWANEPTHSYNFHLDPGELYSVVAHQDTSAVDVDTISHNGYSMAFKLFLSLSIGVTQVTFCTEVTPALSSECRKLTAIKIEAEIRNPAKDPNDRESFMGSLIGDHSSIGSLSTDITLHKVVSHYRLFKNVSTLSYSCGAGRYFLSKSQLNADNRM